MKEYAVKIGEGNIAVEDTLLVKGYPAVAGSRILEGFEPLFSAEAVTRLEQAGYALSGKAGLGEFGLNLYSPAADFAKENKAVLGVGVNGAPERGAAKAGVTFFKPTYGTVSRYGVISTAASGETVGVYAKSADEIREVLSVIAGHDHKDGTSLPAEKYTYAAEEVKGKKIALATELLALCDEEEKGKVLAFAEEAKKAGAEVVEIKTDLFRKAAAAWQILYSAETCNNLSRYDGVKYGRRAEQYKNIDELYTASRTEGFTFATRAIILYGSDVLSKGRYTECYDKALRVRRVVAEELKKIFQDYDAILKPVISSLSVEEGEGKEAFLRLADEAAFISAEYLTGIPAVSFGGVSLAADHFKENTLLGLAALGERMGK